MIHVRNYFLKKNPKNTSRCSMLSTYVIGIAITHLVVDTGTFERVQKYSLADFNCFKVCIHVLPTNFVFLSKLKTLQNVNS